MRLEYLMYLCEVEKSGSINSSAEKLHISQQGLNKALKSLEKELDLSLFQTSNRGILLTEEGKLVVEAAGDLLARWQRLEQDLEKLHPKDLPCRNVSLVYTPGVGEFFISSVLAGFSANHPDIALTLSSGDHLQIAKAVSEGRADLGLVGLQYGILDRIFPELEEIPNISFQPLYQYKICILAGAGSPIARYHSVSMRTVLKYPIVLTSRGPLEENTSYRWLKLYGEPDIRFNTPDVNIYDHLISSGEAIGFSSVQRHCGLNIEKKAGTVTIPLRDEGSTSTVGYFYRSEEPLSSAARSVADHLTMFCV